MIMHDCLIGAALAAFAATTLPSWLRGVAVLMIAAAVTCALFPTYAQFTFNFATGSTLLYAVTAAWSRPRA